LNIDLSFAFAHAFVPAAEKGRQLQRAVVPLASSETGFAV
jgi:hypothetical protein